MAQFGFNGIHRDEIISGVKAGRLRKAAAAKVKFHKSRAAHWTKERETAHKKIIKTGFKLELLPQLGTTTGYASNKVQSAEVDEKLVNHWRTCNMKVEQHRAKEREFRKWVSFLDPKNCDSNDGDEEMLELTFADMDYFGMLVEEPAGND